MKKLILPAMIALLLTSSAGAADFSTPLMGIDGQTIHNTDANGQPTAQVLTLGMVVSNALLATYPDETALPAEEKFQRGILGIKISEATSNLDLTVEQATLAKKLVAKLYGPLVVARVWPLLDPAAK